MNTLLLRDGIALKQNRNKKTADRKTRCGQICNIEPDLFINNKFGFFVLGFGFDFWGSTWFQGVMRHLASP